MRLADMVSDARALCIDSRKAAPGALFFALPGQNADGSKFAQAAIDKGAAAVVSEKEKPADVSVPWAVVPDVREALAQACRTFYKRDQAATKYAGVTGTNGKTTLTYVMESILSAAGESPAVIGTIEHRLGDRRFPTEHTTPDAITLCERIAELESAGATWVVMEVSSHGLDQKRADALRFHVAGFTNLTPDHLDYHGTMDRYFQAKARLFTELSDVGVINIDGAGGKDMLKKVRGRALSVSHKEAADVQVTQSESSRTGTRLSLKTPRGPLEVKSRLVGDFNVENVTLAIGMAIGANVRDVAIERGIERLSGVPGRLERIMAADGRLGFVDYAHTPDALGRVLTTLKALPHDRIVCVFGCGGDRDRTKRPLMGEVVARLADVAIVTSDNPRTEDPEAIVDDITPGIERTGKKYQRILDRREAIRRAAELAGPKDIVLVAGKGHEPYQILGTTKHHFDDREELAAAFAEAAR